MKTAAHQYEDKLLEFAYGELPTREAEAVDAHLHGCARCSEALAQIRSVRSAMSALPREAAPTAGLDSLLAYAEQHAQRTRQAAPRRWWTRYLLPLAPLAAMAVVGVVAYRANQDYQPDPLRAAVDARREERKNHAQEKALAEAPAPVAAAQPQAAPPPPAALDDGAQQRPAGNMLAQAEGGQATLKELKAGKAGAVGGTARPQRQPASDEEQAPVAAVKRSRQDKAQKDAEADAAFAGGLGTAAGGEGYVQRESVAKRAVGSKKKGAPAPEVAVAESVAKVPSEAPGYGLDVGQANAKDAPAKPSGQVARAEPLEQKQAEDRLAAAGPQQAPSTQAVAPAAPVAPPPQQQGAYAPPKSLSVGLNSGTSISSSAQGSRDELADAIEEGVDRKAENERADAQRRRRTQELDAKLEEARKASKSGNHKLEIARCLEVLKAGAEGYQRAEALKRLCDVYEAVGATAEADPYCDALVRDFSATAAARDVMERRSMMQTTLPAKGAKPPAKAKARPAEAAPASEAFH